MNSSQVLAAVENGAHSHNNSYSGVSSGSYDPFAFGYNSTYGHIAVQLNGQSLRYWPLNSSYTTPSAMSPVNPSNFGNGNRANGSYNQTQSSYPYMVGDHNFIWYWRGSSYNAEIWAINLENGQDFFLNLNANATPHYTINMGSDAVHMAVGHRPSDDRFIIYYGHNGSNIRYAVIEQTATAMRAINTTTFSTITKRESGNININPSMSTSYRNSAVLGHDINGNLTYHRTSSNGLRTVDLSNTEIGTLEQTRNFSTASHQDNNQLNARRFKRLTAAEAASRNLTAPTFGIQLLGVKSTT